MDDDAEFLFKGVSNFLLKEITVSGPDGTQEKIEVPVWNGTAANIILMSLGPRFGTYKHQHSLIIVTRTAPEILLSIIGILFNDFKADPLGNRCCRKLFLISNREHFADNVLVGMKWM